MLGLFVMIPPTARLPPLATINVMFEFTVLSNEMEAATAAVPLGIVRFRVLAVVLLSETDSPALGAPFGVQMVDVFQFALVDPTHVLSAPYNRKTDELHIRTASSRWTQRFALFIEGLSFRENTGSFPHTIR